VIHVIGRDHADRNDMVRRRDNRVGRHAEVETERARHEALVSRKLAEAEQRIAQSKTMAVAGVNEIAADIAGAIVARLIATDVSKDELQRVLMPSAAE